MPLLGKHRDRGRTAGLVLDCERGRVGDVGQCTFAGTGSLDLSDYGNTRPAEARHWIDGGIDVLTSFFQPFQRNLALLNGQVLPDSGNDVV
jgi:hypothetical protein